MKGSLLIKQSKAQYKMKPCLVKNEGMKHNKGEEAQCEGEGSEKEFKTGLLSQLKVPTDVVSPLKSLNYI